ncbi:hypothetical protein D3C85_1403590 [compost metagenome]
MLVIAFQIASHDRFGHGQATGAAEFARLAQDGGGVAAAGGDGQGAVEARGWAGHGIFRKITQTCRSCRKAAIERAAVAGPSGP